MAPEQTAGSGTPLCYEEGCLLSMKVFLFARIPPSQMEELIHSAASSSASFPKAGLAPPAAPHVHMSPWQLPAPEDCSGTSWGTLHAAFPQALMASLHHPFATRKSFCLIMH